MRFRPLVLCYHAVSDGWTDPLAVTPAALEAQVRDLLRRGFRPVSAEATLDNAARTLHVTFDDAYRNVASVLPTLARLGVPVTVFACSRYADRGDPLDVPELRGRADGAPGALDTMSWEALREWAERGVTIGSHTCSHPHLPLLDDFELRRELTESKERVEDEIGGPCTTLAYPYGEEDERVRANARHAGYTVGFSLRGENRALDPYAVPRVDVYRPDGKLRFAAKTSVLRAPAVKVLDTVRRREP
jgi:peptidoglycan/xylan/chitin deacetylase (PgdA/CDA1 family)